MGDCDWLDSDEDMSGVDSHSFARIQTDMRTEGIRAGVDAGREKALQTGFNAGYRAGMLRVMEMCVLRGRLVGVLCHIMSRTGTQGKQKSGNSGDKSLNDAASDQQANQSTTLCDSERSFVVSDADIEEIQAMISDLAEAERVVQTMGFVTKANGSKTISDDNAEPKSGGDLDGIKSAGSEEADHSDSGCCKSEQSENDSTCKNISKSSVNDKCSNEGSCCSKTVNVVGLNEESVLRCERVDRDLGEYTSKYIVKAQSLMDRLSV